MSTQLSINTYQFLKTINLQSPDVDVLSTIESDFYTIRLVSFVALIVMLATSVYASVLFVRYYNIVVNKYNHQISKKEVDNQ